MNEENNGKPVMLALLYENDQEKIRAAWAKHAAELTRWAYRCLFARDDTYPWWRHDAKPNPGWRRNFAELTGEELNRHFQGLGTIGTYTLGRDNHCIYTGEDIDAHEGQEADPAANFAYSMRLYERLLGLGAHPLLEDSNGKGGYHVWTRFLERIPGHLARSVALWLIKDAPPAIHVEAFPKQAASPYGNQMRLPGKHHRHDHWSRFWDGERWLTGEDAVQYLLAWQATDPAVFPAEARKYTPPKSSSKPPTRLRASDGESWDDSDGHWVKQFDGNLRTLDIVALCEDRLTGDDGGNRYGILCPWHDGHTTGDGGTCVWIAEDGRYPGFNCLHAHCQNRTLQDLLEFFGKEAVDKCCAEQFGDHSHDHDEQVEEIVKGGELPPKPSGNGETTEEFVGEVAKEQPAQQIATETTPKPSKNGQTTPNVVPSNGQPADDFIQEIKREQEAQEKKATTKSARKRAYTISELSRLPKPTWHVQGMFTEQSIVILWGESGSGKTFLALDWGLCTATGLPWLETHGVKQGSVVYIASEGKSGLPKRCLRWLEYHAQPEPDNFWIVPEAFELVQQESFADLVRIISDLGERHAMIVIDTLNRNLGGSENDGDDMRAFTKAADLLQRTFGATVLVIHHTGWDNARERGHSSLRGNSDTMISARKLGERLTDGIEVKCVKQKDSDLFDTFGVACQIEGDGDDSSLVLTERIDTGKLTEERKQERLDERLTPVLKCLPEDANRPMALPDLVTASSMPKTTCYRLLGDAINAEYVVRVGVKQPRYYLTAAGKAVVARQTDFQFGIV